MTADHAGGLLLIMTGTFGASRGGRCLRHAGAGRTLPDCCAAARVRALSGPAWAHLLVFGGCCGGWPPGPRARRRTAVPRKGAVDALIALVRGRATALYFA